MLTFNIYARLGMVWESPLSELFGVLQILALDLKVMKFACFAGTTALLPRYIFKLIGLPVGGSLLIAAAAVMYAIPTTRKHSYFTIIDLQNSAGLLFSVLFIAVTLVSIEGFQCVDHPNGKSSLILDRSLVCWEGGEHAGLVVASVIAMLVYPVAFLGLTGFLTWKYHTFSRMYGTRFTFRTRFLVNRMSPNFYFVGFWYNLRNFALTLCPLIATGNYTIQVFLLMTVFVSWLSVQMHWKPWRFPILNVFDCFTSCMQILVLTCFSSMRGPQETSSTSEVGWFIIVIFSLVTLVLLGAGAFKMCQRFFSKKEYGIFLTHHKAGAGLFARLITMVLQGNCNRKVFLDVDELDNLDNLNFTIRTNCDNVVVLDSGETFSRFWCGMETVSAWANRVKILIAITNGSEASSLTEEFLKSVPALWSESEYMELTKQGITTENVIDAYTYMASLPAFQLPFNCPSEEMQESFAVTILKETVDCTLRVASLPVDPEKVVYLLHDTKDPKQACAARVMRRLFAEGRWTCHLLTAANKVEEMSKAGGKTEVRSGVAIVFLSSDILKDDTCHKHLIALRARQLPIVTVLSQEDYAKPDEALLTQIQSHSPKIAEELRALYKILAWRFSPQDSQSVMRAEFQRIADRAEIEFLRRTDQIHNEAGNLKANGGSNEEKGMAPPAMSEAKGNVDPSEKELAWF
jgi:hypothetical protein